ncbi:MAG: hypothetical protein M3R01_13120 [Actinomycetota bacterium]|nr:hypothetical protein [Actinomycetota bacterium]
MTEVLDKLTAELVGLREDVRTERRGRRLSVAVIVVALIVATGVGAVGYVNYRTLADRQTSDQQEQAVEVRANRYDQQAGLNDACQANNDNRDSRRRLFLNLYDLVETAPPPVPRTPGEQKFVDDFLAQARADVLAETIPIDCDAVAPPPEGDRPS